MKKIITFFVAIALAAMSYAQLPDGSFVPDFTVYEINKTTGNMITNQPINLYSILNDGKTVFIDVSATWCGPCWNFHQSGTLDGIWTNYGPNSSNYDSYVIWMEGSQGNYASLSGTGADAGGSASQGNWLNGVEYPIVPLNMSPNSANQYSILGGLSIAYYPTIYMVCPNRMAFELSNSGSNQSESWHNLIATTCPPVNTNDAMLVNGRISKSVYYCSYNFQPQIVIQNVGTAPLTAATLRLTHGSDVGTVDWTGNLAQYETATVTLPTVEGNENGSQTLTVEIVSVNGQADESDFNSTYSETFMAQVTAESATSSQDFSANEVEYPWSLDDHTNGYSIVYQGAFLFNSYSISAGGMAELYSPLLNFSNSFNPQLFFDLCYRRYDNYSNDRLQIMVSSDCGSTWTTVFDKSGTDLATGTNTTSNYLADQYVEQYVDLAQFGLQERVIVKFVFTSDYGNNIWIDNVNITYINPPTVTTSSATDVATNTATCGGDVTDDGGETVTARGVCWSTSPNPTVSDSHTTNGTGNGNFTSSITGLSPNTTYYVRAYATNSVGTGYGNEVTLQTSCGTVNVEISGDTEICEGDVATLTATGAATYQWNTGSTGNILTTSTEGTYSVTGTDTYGCPGTASITLIAHSVTIPILTIDGEISACQSSSATISLENNYTSYLWSTGETTASIEVSMPGYYWVDVTDENGCVASSEITHLGASILIPETPVLCMVSVENGQNLVVWEEIENTNVQNYRIYRENGQTDTYELLATVPASRGNAYEDLTADPSARDYRYKVTAMDVCQGETPMSEPHKSIHLTANRGTGNSWDLVWTPYEGMAFANYKLYRGTANNNLQVIATLPSTATSYTDLNDVTGPLFYQIEVEMNGSCVRHTRDVTYNGARSNLFYNGENVYIDTAVLACEEYEWLDSTYTQSGVYYKVYTSELGYDVHAVLHLNIAHAPNYTVSGASTIVAGGSTTLSVTPTNPQWTYLWSTGATTSSITVSPTETTTYSVTVTNGPCVETATGTVTVVTGVNEWGNGIVSLYPNLTDDIVNVRFTNGNGKTPKYGCMMYMDGCYVP